MRVYRLNRKKYAQQLSGHGAALSSNRWNSKGVEMIYTAQNRALALAEVAVHFSVGTLPSGYVMMEIEIPDSLEISQIPEADLPANWNRFPHIMETRLMGDAFIHEKKEVVCKVPSAVVPGEYNFLINPNHPDMEKIRICEITDFPIDHRLFP
ncbi:RES family NAD+ phosphorylase [Robertkochia flava]|uniref:RES family NAD+ phosphorylase n=1 Tax=Robertkochia flava TaxID=3447986 RepID=UPI001CCD9535|nr:RES family NAD+ phosphorylase [Robertkochia marina]